MVRLHSVQKPTIPEVNITIPGLDKTAQEISSLAKAISQAPQHLRLEASQLVSSIEDRLNIMQAAYQSGFVSGVILALVVVAAFFFLSKARNQHGV